MAMQILLVGKSYPLSKYVLVLLLCAGIAMFVLNPVRCVARPLPYTRSHTVISLYLYLV